MGKRDNVYDEVLSGYLALRNDMLNKERTAAEKIEKAQNSIDNNSALMNEAVTSGDQAFYTKLFEENIKNNATIQFFREVLKKAKDSTGAEADAHELYKKADAEIVRIKSEYEKEMRKALAPIIDMSNEALLQVELLEFAKNRILFNLEHKPEKFRIRFNYNDIPLMRGLNQMLQSPDCIKEMCGKGVSDPGTMTAVIANGNKWDNPAISRFNEEAAKWI